MTSRTAPTPAAPDTPRPSTLSDDELPRRLAVKLSRDHVVVPLTWLLELLRNQTTTATPQPHEDTPEPHTDDPETPTPDAPTKPTGTKPTRGEPSDGGYPRDPSAPFGYNPVPAHRLAALLTDAAGETGARNHDGTRPEPPEGQ